MWESRRSICNCKDPAQIHGAQHYKAAHCQYISICGVGGLQVNRINNDRHYLTEIDPGRSPARQKGLYGGKRLRNVTVLFCETCRTMLVRPVGSIMCVCRLLAGIGFTSKSWRSGVRWSDLLKFSPNLGPITCRNIKNELVGRFHVLPSLVIENKLSMLMQLKKWRENCADTMCWHWNNSEVAQSPPLAPLYQLRIKKAKGKKGKSHSVSTVVTFP